MGHRVNSDESGLHLSDLFKMVFNHFILIVLICIVSLAIGIVISICVEDKYDIYATYDVVHVDSSIFSKYGYSVNDLDHFIFILTSDDIIMDSYSRAGFEKSDYLLNNLKSKIKIKKEVSTGFLSVEMVNVPENEILPFSNMLNLLVEKAAEIYVAGINSKALIVKDLVIDNLDQAKSIFDIVEGNIIIHDNVTSSALNRFYECKDDLFRINSELELLKNPIVVHKAPTRSFDKLNMSNSLIYILSIFIGGCIGVCVAFAIDFNDDHIYDSRCFISGKLMGSIPLYKNSDIIDYRNFAFMKSELKNYESILVTSILENAGRHSVAKGLDPLKVFVADTLIDNPSVIDKMKSFDFNLIVLRNGLDEARNVINLSDELHALEIDNYAFVLNGVDVRDRGVTIYSDISNYRRFRWLFRSKRNFYRKYYKEGLE